LRKCSRQGGKRRNKKVLLGNAKKKRTSGQPRHRWKDIRNRECGLDLFGSG
jgi:hypothetical protein